MPFGKKSNESKKGTVKLQTFIKKYNFCFGHPLQQCVQTLVTCLEGSGSPLKIIKAKGHCAPTEYCAHTVTVQNTL